MFRVIVLGGVALVGAQACGGQESSGPADASTDATSEEGTDTYFPGELPVFVDSGTIDTAPETFPGELPVFVDTGTDAGDADGDTEDGFPHEAPK